MSEGIKLRLSAGLLVTGWIITSLLKNSTIGCGRGVKRQVASVFYIFKPHSLLLAGLGHVVTKGWIKQVNARLVNRTPVSLCEGIPRTHWSWHLQTVLSADGSPAPPDHRTARCHFLSACHAPFSCRQQPVSFISIPYQTYEEVSIMLTAHQYSGFSILSKKSSSSSLFLIGL